MAKHSGWNLSTPLANFQRLSWVAARLDEKCNTDQLMVANCYFCRPLIMRACVAFYPLRGSNPVGVC